MQVDAQYHLPSTLSGLRMGAGDPCVRIDGGGWRGAQATPDGPAVLQVRQEGSRLNVELTGPGASWLEPRVPAWLGLEDDPSGFQPGRRLDRLHRRYPGIRLPRVPRILPTLVQIVLQQLVTVGEGYRAWRNLLREHGEQLSDGLYVPLEAGTLSRISVDEYIRLGVLPRQARTIRRLARLEPALERAAAEGPQAFVSVLHAVPGVGPWTVQNALGGGLGFADAVPVEDVHLPNTVSWALAGEPRGDDRRMLELLEPYRGHRYRVFRLLFVSGIKAPRRGPRRAPRPLPRMS
ncbi:hypothetical protein ABI59_17405 [Acidobacteria bacterium Mor1]|nr:hypothetical protein ABI59_17405 [Acidobacteria bacterium Mor1]